MISKVITGRTFRGTCRYVCGNLQRGVVIAAEGVRDYEWKKMADDFERQQASRPSLKVSVFHGILSFYPGEKPVDEMMIQIAKESLEKLGIVDTQFSITKHTDKDHLHLHIIANLVNNKGESIKDNWIGLRSKKIAQELTLKYGLQEAKGKDLSKTKLQSLHGKDGNRYAIYQAIERNLLHCKNLEELKQKLQADGIETLYKYKGQTTELQGISFKLGEYKYKGSEIDRRFSVGNLQKAMQQQTGKDLNQTALIHQQTRSKDQKVSGWQEKQLELSRSRSEKENLAELLMKPAENYQSIPQQWKLQKKKKKKKKLHL